MLRLIPYIYNGQCVSTNYLPLELIIFFACSHECTPYIELGAPNPYDQSHLQPMAIK
jgi:hypothetical protein